MGVAHLDKARAVKNDEFYTQRVDVDRGMAQFTDRDPDVFRGKTVLLPCDDPEWSAFTRHFLDHFHAYGLARLISTCYAKPTEIMGEQPCGRVLDTTTGDESWSYLAGDGDFRSPEVTAYRDQADVIITNPPFSQLNDFMGWVTGADANVAVVAPATALGYRGVFPHILHGRVWVGDSGYKAPSKFRLPGNQGVKDVSTVWLTSVASNPRRHSPLPLRAMAENRALADGKRAARFLYRNYDNCPAMEVPRVEWIPADYDGLMGVPLSFLQKHPPHQFELVGITSQYDPWFAVHGKKYGQQRCCRDGDLVRVNNSLDKGGAFIHTPEPGDYYVEVQGVPHVGTFMRVIIRIR